VPSPRHQAVRFEAPDFAAIEEARTQYKSVELSAHTVASYARSLRVFRAWCEASALASLPASEETVELYVTDLLRCGRKISTAELHCYAIQHAHRVAGHSNPFGAGVKKLLSGAKRVLCQFPVQKAALEIQEIRKIVRRLGWQTPIAARNCALLLFGFATALRRSTLAELRPEDVAFTREGLLVTVRHEKQDRKGRGRHVAVPHGKHPGTCPVKMLRRWIKLRGDVPGVLFCRVMYGRPDGLPILGNRIGGIVQEMVALIGLPKAEYAAHPTRAGFVPEALARRRNEVAAARTSLDSGPRSVTFFATVNLSAAPAQDGSETEFAELAGSPAAADGGSGGRCDPSRASRRPPSTGPASTSG